ncbi:hypothetical protein BB381_02815 [Campylobacter pinnipediorum subsp. caledonicus]|uniref:TonB-dependent receptor domain-containing protein n=1 Tax=Campylobacter pinnipediorum TaxID=1965231 RepID=UPI0009949B7F|nr:TonB-dependent receptor [Campylobacter pinnipediorum]OPA71444.1 hypothetical protein BB381_02815 [Campylobacter pinnipediorum subsp. caledonicus]
MDTARKKVSQSFRVGGGDNVEGETFQPKLDDDGNIQRDPSGDIIYLDSKGNEHFISGFPPYSPESLSQKPKSTLTKLEYKDGLSNLILSYRNYKTALAGRKVKQDNYQLEYNLNPQDIKQLDFNLLYAINTGEQIYAPHSRFAGVELLKNIKTKNIGKTIDISNTFTHDFKSDSNLKTTIGVNLLKNEYKKSRHPSELNFIEDSLKDAIGIAASKSGREANTLYPEGEQKFNTIYIDNELNNGPFTFNMSVNYSKNKFKGEKYYYYGLDNDDIGIQYLKDRYGEDLLTSNDPDKKAILEKYYEFDSDVYQNTLKRNKAINDKDYNNPILKYFRCPNSRLCKVQDESIENFLTPIQEEVNGGSRNKITELDNEKMYDNGSHKHFNYSFGASVYINDLFSPFVNYSKTHREPNIKEMFFSDLGHYGVNSKLKPETATTKQIGFNSFKDGLFIEDDEFGLKFIRYKTEIKDYIHNVRYKEPHIISNYPYIKHYNFEKLVTIQGYEIEASYDNGTFYANLAYSRQKTNQPLNFTDSSPRVDESKSDTEIDFQGYGLTKITILPKDYATLDIGTRFGNKKFTLGSTIKYYGKSRITSNTVETLYCDGTVMKKGDTTQNPICGNVKKEQEINRQPFIFDLYTIANISNNLTIKFEIKNLFDKKYINPLDSNNDSAGQFIFDLGVGDTYQFANNNFARGRTAMMSINYKY